ncbi:hypothetical protein MKW92_006969 [Papaver armeniacum]|nr:hypothetical protein MKW92_006969 [Papaver armeniacum]
MSDEVALLDFWASPYGMRIRICLAEKGIKYEYINENLRPTKGDLLLKMNPVNQKIPVMIHNGKPISESLIIVQYIDEVWNAESPSWLPADPYQRANARFWGDYIDKKVYDYGKKVFITRGEEREIAKKEFVDILKVLEGELGEKLYFGGDNFGFVDIALIPFYSWFYSFEMAGNFSIEKECPKLVGWAKKCTENASVSKTLPDPVETFEELKTWYPIV